MGKMESILCADDTRYARSLTPKVCAAVFKVWKGWSACLVRDACIYDGAKQGKFIVSSRMLAAAERCLELGVARFSFWDPFDLQRVPPALWCVPE
jgi:hypothetical protein